MSNLIPETDRTIVFTPDGEPYMHMLTVCANLEANAMESLGEVSEEFANGMTHVIEFLNTQREILTLEHKMRMA